jgi:hypothetical protein
MSLTDHQSTGACQYELPLAAGSFDPAHDYRSLRASSRRKIREYRSRMEQSKSGNTATAVYINSCRLNLTTQIPIAPELTPSMLPYSRVFLP